MMREGEEKEKGEEKKEIQRSRSDSQKDEKNRYKAHAIFFWEKSREMMAPREREHEGKGSLFKKQRICKRRGTV